MIKTNKKTTDEKASLQAAGAMSATPPAFQLQASNMNTAASGGPYNERVANFPKVMQQIISGAESKDITLVFNGLEALKNDAGEVLQFESYFQEKMGLSFREYLGTKFPEEDLSWLLDDLETKDTDDDKGDGKSYQEWAQTLHNWLESGEKSFLEIESVILLMDRPEKLSKAYRELFGVELYDELNKAGGKFPNFKVFIDNAFKKTQNYENVTVKSEAEAQKARKLIAAIWDEFQVDVNSQKALEMVRGTDELPPEVLAKVQISNWTLADLESLYEVLQKFSAITGKNRQDSSRKGSDQEVDFIGRVTNHMIVKEDEDGGKRYLVRDAIGGAHYSGNEGVAIYDNARSKSFDKSNKVMEKSSKEAFKSVIAHELGHGFLDYAEKEFVEKMRFWKNFDEPVRTWKVKDPRTGYEFTKAASTVEAPPTHYGTTNAGEDLAETVSLYLTNPMRLRTGSWYYKSLSHNPDSRGMIGNPCPIRYRFIKEKIEAWKKK